ncbi:MAG: hypothetical protein CMH62_00805 [Nanoarchaeota archaeon]|nr:hypothetical protein [Nanoarchaeota archaeon]|tara:strand:- start:527 stop:925 length:399 start_codon:yes stop_codon:yes gene_type:complete
MEIQIKAIIEILGKPKEHVEETLKKVLNELSERKGVTVLHKEVAETKELEKFFSTYVDLELKLDELDNLIDFCFDFLPSSVEILKPEKINMESHAFAEYMNDLLAKLHQHSMIIRNLHAENIAMKEKLGEKN